MSAIGVFDSGVGGLTVVSALRRILPSQPILYLGDTARLPYGTKSSATVERYAERNVRFLVERDVKGVVIACNTASAVALPHLKAGLPLWGVVEPGAARAAAVSKGRVGVIATESTIASGAYERALHRQRADLEVFSLACPLFVPLVEEGWHADPVTRQIAERYLTPLLDDGIDTLVLGCTHYPLLRPLLQEVVGPGVTLVDSADSVAARVADDLDPEHLTEHDAPGAATFFVTDAARRFARIGRAILGDDSLELELVDVH